MARKLLILLVFAVFALNIASTLFILHATHQALLPTARATNEGTATFCFNHPPSLSVPCDPLMSQDQHYFCQLNASDPDGANLSFFQIPQPPDNTSLFNISPSGLINFTPTNDDRGNHSTMLGVDDNSGCENAYAYFLFNFTIANVNDPPYLIREIPNQEFSSGTTLVAFKLDDYFADPDDDPLSYRLIQSTSEVTMNATIRPDSSVVFTSSECGKAYFKFIATDPGNLSAESNLVLVEAKCEDEGGGENAGGAGGGGSAGGGGGTCKPEMICLPWSDCFPNGLQVQKCYDKNGCSDDEVKFYQECVYQEERPTCLENWLCSPWGACMPNGLQNRTCTDLNECHTRHSLPPLQQECVYTPTCSDGMQNGGETGVDCGGPCPPCKEIQQPTPLPEESGFPTLLALLLILLLSILLSLFVLYREKIYEGMASLGWLLARRREKEVLLSPAEKQTLFEQLLSIDEADEPLLLYERLAELIRTFYSFVLDLPFDAQLEAFQHALREKGLSKELFTIFFSFLARLSLLESGTLPKASLPRLLIRSTIEELRLLVCLTSDYSLEEIARELPERKITPDLSFTEEIWLRLLTGYEALQFLRLDVAKEQYTAILRAYNALAPGKRELLYAALNRFYYELLYVQETSEWSSGSA